MRLFLFATLLLCTFAQDDFGDFENDFDNEVRFKWNKCLNLFKNKNKTILKFE